MLDEHHRGNRGKGEKEMVKRETYGMNELSFFTWRGGAT